MTPEDAVILRNAALSTYVLPGLILALCVFGGAAVSFGAGRKRATAVIPGVFFAVSGLYLGDGYTAVPLMFFGSAVVCGLFVARRFPARARHAPRVRQLE